MGQALARPNEAIVADELANELREQDTRAFSSEVATGSRQDTRRKHGNTVTDAKDDQNSIASAPTGHPPADANQ